MNKTELIDAVAAKAGVTKKAAGDVLAAFIETVQAEEKVQLVGFGTFQKKTRAARKGRNPQTGKEIDIPAKTALAFSASKAK